MKIKNVDDTISDMADCIIDGMDLKTITQFARDCMVDNLISVLKNDGENGLIEQAEACGFEITYDESTYIDGNGRERVQGICAMCKDPLTQETTNVTIDGRTVCNDCAENTV